MLIIEKHTNFELKMYPKLGVKGIVIEVNFGGKNYSVLNEEIKNILREKLTECNNIIDPLNYLTSLGWEFVQSYTYTWEFGDHLYYIFRKKIDKI